MRDRTENRPLTGVCPRWQSFWCLMVSCVCLQAGAAVINVGPADSYAKIEAAKAGDEVIIAPGTYAFRVYLTAQGSATNPIIIRAQNPANPPVWDFGSTLVESAPGSYTAGDRGRGGWQFSGARHYQVSGIVFRNCRTASKNSAGVRYYNGSTNLYLKDCLFIQNDNGLTGGTQESEIAVEFCEFDSNGNLAATAATHNLYIYGGTFAMRYCYVHDSVQSQNFHIRARNATIEYNWFARAKAYEGDLMSDDDFSGAGPFSQTMTLRGNVILQHASPDNHSQVIAVFNDTGLANLTLSVRLVHNTFIGNDGSAALVHLSNADGTSMNGEESNNIIFGTTRPYLIENAATASMTGVNNWLRTNATVGVLAGSVQSASPGFANAAANDFTLASNSVCVAAANATVFGLPGKEYFRNEITKRMWRVRASARDIGAFESKSIGGGIGPYDPAPLPQLSIWPAGTNIVVMWPLFAGDYRLEAAILTNPLSWNAPGNPNSTNPVDIRVTNSAAPPGRLYRLKK
jgi:hypothetical protein